MLAATMTLYLSLDFFLFSFFLLKTVNLLARWTQSFQQPPVEMPGLA